MIGIKDNNKIFLFVDSATKKAAPYQRDHLQNADQTSAHVEAHNSTHVACNSPIILDENKAVAYHTRNSIKYTKPFEKTFGLIDNHRVGE